MFLNCVGPLTVDFFQQRTLPVFTAYPRWLNPRMWGTVAWKVIVRVLTGQGGWSTLLIPRCLIWFSHCADFDRGELEIKGLLNLFPRREISHMGRWVIEWGKICLFSKVGSQMTSQKSSRCLNSKTGGWPWLLQNMGTGSVQVAVLSWSPEGLADCPVWPLHPVLMMGRGGGRWGGKERGGERTVCIVGTPLWPVRTRSLHL